MIRNIIMMNQSVTSYAYDLEITSHDYPATAKLFSWISSYITITNTGAQTVSGNLNCSGYGSVSARTTLVDLPFTSLAPGATVVLLNYWKPYTTALYNIGSTVTWTHALTLTGQTDQNPADNSMVAVVTVIR